MFNQTIFFNSIDVPCSFCALVRGGTIKLLSNLFYQNVMKGKNNCKIISVSLVIALSSIVFGLVGNVNTPIISFAQETNGQITKGTVVLGNIESANLTSGQVQNNTLKNGELSDTNITSATINNGSINKAQNQSSGQQNESKPAGLAQIDGGLIQSAEITNGIMVSGQITGGNVSEDSITNANITDAEIQDANLKGVNMNQVEVRTGNDTTTTTDSDGGGTLGSDTSLGTQ
jgi:uncharacterized protein YjbI with pentapeptide repeats